MRDVDRRAVFFLVAAAAAGALIPVCPEEFQWVAVAVSITYVVLATVSWLDHRSRNWGE